MHRWIQRALLPSVCGLGLLAGVAGAQEPPPYMPGLAPGPGPATPNQYPGHLPASLHPPEKPKHFPLAARAFGWATRQVHNCPGDCAAHHNDLGCSSLQSECKFILGSCRTYFGEPCFKGRVPPPSPYGPGYGRPIDPRWPPAPSPAHP